MILHVNFYIIIHDIRYDIQYDMHVPVCFQIQDPCATGRFAQLRIARVLWALDSIIC